MDTAVLKGDEFEVECLVRGIPTDDSNAAQTLDTIIRAEDASISEIPMKMHPKGRKNPDIESDICRSKLQELKDDLTLLNMQSSENLLHSAHQLESRLLHVLGRLRRLTSSPTYRNSAQNSIKICEQLQASLRLYMEDNDKLNESITAAKLIEVYEEDEPDNNKLPSAATPTNELRPSTELSGRRSTLEDLLDTVQLESQVKQQHLDVQTKLFESALEKFDLLSQQLVLLGQRQDAMQTQLVAINPSYTSTLTGVHAPGSIKGPAPSSIPIGPPIAPSVNPTAPKANIPQPTAANPAMLTAPYLPVFGSGDRPQIPSLTIPRLNHEPFAPMASSLYNQPPSFVPTASANLTSFPAFQNARPLPESRSLARCGIFYDGSPSSVPVEMFVFQLETLASSLNIPEGSVLTEMSFVLKGVALQWYWTCRRHNPAILWPELKIQFLHRFQDRRSDFEIRRLIENRKQLPRETFVEFYHQVWNMTLQCRTPYSEEKLMEILMQNMRAGLQYQLTDRKFQTINDLIASCTAWEDTWNRLRLDPESIYAHRRGISEMTLELPADPFISNQPPSQYPDPVVQGPKVAAYRSTYTDQTNSSNFKSTLQPPANFSRYSANQEVGCYNCDEKGHTFNDCRFPPLHWFCHKCGMKDTVYAKCPKCSENRPRGQWRTGNHGTPKIILPSPKNQTEEAASNTDPELKRLAHTNQQI